MAIRTRNLFALARRNMSLRPDCPKREQGSDSFIIVKLLWVVFRIDSTTLVWWFSRRIPCGKKTHQWLLLLLSQKATTTKTKKQTNKHRVIATTTSAAEKSGSLCLCLTIYTFCVFHSESTFGGANKMELKKNSSHRLKSQERIDTKVSYFMTMNTPLNWASTTHNAKVTALNVR